MCDHLLSGIVVSDLVSYHELPTATLNTTLPSSSIPKKNPLPRISLQSNTGLCDHGYIAGAIHDSTVNAFANSCWFNPEDFIKVLNPSNDNAFPLTPAT